MTADLWKLDPNHQFRVVDKHGREQLLLAKTDRPFWIIRLSSTGGSYMTLELDQASVAGLRRWINLTEGVSSTKRLCLFCRHEFDPEDPQGCNAVVDGQYCQCAECCS